MQLWFVLSCPTFCSRRGRRVQSTNRFLWVFSLALSLFLFFFCSKASVTKKPTSCILFCSHQNTQWIHLVCLSHTHWSYFIYLISLKDLQEGCEMKPSWFLFLFCSSRAPWVVSWYNYGSLVLFVIHLRWILYNVMACLRATDPTGILSGHLSSVSLCSSSSSTSRGRGTSGWKGSHPELFKGQKQSQPHQNKTNQNESK